MANHRGKTTCAADQPHPRPVRHNTSILDITRVVGGRKFCTSTATMACVVACTGGCQLSDFHFERTALFRSPRGQWFLAGEGGACSRWARHASDGARYPGEGVQLISEREARSLLEQHNGPVEAFFEIDEG